MGIRRRAMMEVEQRISEIKAAVAEIEKKRAEQEHRLKLATESYETARESLSSNFGVETPEEALTLLAALERDLQEALEQVEEQLKEASDVR